MRILILDDDEIRLKIFRQKLIGHDVTCVKESKACILCLKENEYSFLFLDHDLGGQIYVKSGENTGYEVAEYLFNNPDRQPKNIIIHSFNPIGAQNMLSLLPNAQLKPGIWSTL